jgi:hypothetical protein
MQAVNQLQIAVDAVQDRLLLRIATNGNEEIRIFITRRFLRELWPTLAKTLATMNQLEVRTLAVDAAEAAAISGSFDEAFRTDNPIYPLGSKPLLANEMSLESDEDGAFRMTLREGRERRFSMNVNDELMQALCAMLRAGSETAGWDLTLDYTTTDHTGSTASPSKILLH